MTLSVSWQGPYATQACMPLVGRPVAIKITRAAYVDPHLQPKPVILWYKKQESEAVLTDQLTCLVALSTSSAESDPERSRTTRMEGASFGANTSATGHDRYILIQYIRI